MPKKIIKSFLKRIEKDVLLKEHTTFRIGGRAKYFYLAKNKNDFIGAISGAKERKIKFFILGGGSNTLASDGGFGGVVIKFYNPDSKVRIKSKSRNPEIFTEACLPLAKLVNFTIKNNLSGLEWAVGIPGTVGGAIFGNAGAFGESMKNIIDKVETFGVKSGKIRFFDKKHCGFSYRKSIFKKNKHLAILSAEFRFKKDRKDRINSRIKKFLDHRKLHQPLDLPSAGSIFINFDNRPAAKLIEECGLKGKKTGKAEISKKHANFIVNSGGASSKDVIKLINLAKKTVKRKFGIALEEEIQYLNDNF